MRMKPPCQGCPPGCSPGCTWANAQASTGVQIAEVIIPEKEYGCIHGGDITRTTDGRVGILRSGKTYTGFAELTEKGSQFLKDTRPELARQLGV